MSSCVIAACGPLFVQTQTPTTEDTESGGFLQRMVEKARETKEKIENIGGSLMGFAGAYYEDHIQPVTGRYTEWASNAEKTVTVWKCTSSTTAEMNGKYALALILALQVSMSLCDIPAPEQELVDKYNEMKGVFYKRLLNAYNKLHAAAGPVVEKLGDSEQSTAARNFIEDLQTKPEFQTFVKVATGMGDEVGPLMEKASLNTLGVYGYYLRPYIGSYLDTAINHIKIYLDRFLPAEE
ncbi:hypothetical protein LDENG_00100170 [Lucifuga dentata]|nr:hypothetical protein LDENG_00100170 [Lucifuga dentata]